MYEILIKRRGIFSKFPRKSGNVLASRGPVREARIPSILALGVCQSNFNIKKYDPWKLSCDAFVCGKTDIGNTLTDELHPCPYKLSWRIKPFLNRKDHQILGYEGYPMADFVVCCADVDKDGHEVGGTGHACRIARKYNVPVVNIRDNDKYKKRIEQLMELMK